MQRTRDAADTAIALAAEHELVAWLAWATVLRGWASVEQGQIDEGIAQIRQGIAGWRTGGAGCLHSYFLSLLADVQAKAGQMDDGLATVAEALAMVAETGEGVAEAELHRIKGELLRDEPEAEDCFHHAIEIARRQKAKSFELRAVMSLSRCYAQQDRRTEARQMLAEIYGWFTEGFDTPDLKDAAALLRDLES